MKVNNVQNGWCCRTEAVQEFSKINTALRKMQEGLPKNQSEKGAKTYACNH